MIEINWRPGRRELRQFALVSLPVVTAIAAGVAWLRFQQPAAAGAIAAGGTVLALVGLAAPPLLRPIYLAWMALALVLGTVVSNVLLAAIYWLLITPLGLAMRLAGRDRLGRRFDRQVTTYWTPTAAPRDKERYFRQY